MEVKKYKFIKNMLWPVPIRLEIGQEGVLYKNHFVKWTDITACSYHISSVNRAMNYIIACDVKNGKDIYLNYIVTIAGTKKKKAMFAEIYSLFHQNLKKHLIDPASEQALKEISAGKEVKLQNVLISQKGLDIALGMRQKKRAFIPMSEVKTYFQGGGFIIQSSVNNKASMYIDLAGGESRFLLAMVSKLFPGQLDEEQY